MSAGDEDLFRQEMSSVTPLKRDARVLRTPSGQAESADALAHRRQAAVSAQEQDRNSLSDQEIPPLDAWYVLSFKRPGVQNGVFRKLKQGRYEAHARLDLHRMTTARARLEVFGFIEESHAYGLRSVLVIHGKGESKPEQQRASALKGCVNHWLRELDVVQAFHSAQPQHGGTGAVYVLLRKSERAKEEAREKFSRGRTTP